MNLMTEGIKKGRKYAQVLEGARQVFMSDGFEGASVDNISKSAGVSKATLYSYFPDKKSLFSEVARVECNRQADAALDNIDMSASPERVLRAAAGHMINFFSSDFGQRIFRICVAESDRFPELGAAFYASGPTIVKEKFGMYFRQAVAEGKLTIDDYDLAACQFAELCKADIFLRQVFGIQREFSQKEIDRVIDGAVETFLARYAT